MLESSRALDTEFALLSFVRTPAFWKQIKTMCIASIQLSRKCEPRKEVSPPSELFLLNISLGVHSFDTHHHNNTKLPRAFYFFLQPTQPHNQYGRSTITFLPPTSLTLL